MWGCEFEGIEVKEVKEMKRVFPESNDFGCKGLMGVGDRESHRSKGVREIMLYWEVGCC